MTETLRPLTLGEILDRTAQLYRHNFWLFAGTAAMPFAVIFGLAAVAVPAGLFAVPGIAGNAGNNAQISAMAGAIGGVAFVLAFLIVLPIYLALYVYAISAITQATVATHRGEKLTIRGALKMVSPRFWTYLWYLILQGIMAGIVPIGLAAVIIGPLLFAITRPGVGIGGGVALGFLAFAVGAGAIFAMVWLVLSYSMGLAVCVVEKKSAWESLNRAMQLSKGTRGRIFVLFLLLMVLSMAVSAVSYIVALLVGAVASLMGNGSAAAIAAAVVGGILYILITFGSQVVLQPVSWIALVLFYYDQRIRKEGFDIEWMMQQAGMTQPATATPISAVGNISAPAGPPDTVEER